MKRKIEYEKSTGNIFQDLGFKKPEEESLKARLALKIFQATKERNLTQEKVAEILEVSHPEVSKLKHGRFSRFRISRLFMFLNRLNYNIDIRVSESRDHHPYQRVSI